MKENSNPSLECIKGNILQNQICDLKKAQKTAENALQLCHCSKPGLGEYKTMVYIHTCTYTYTYMYTYTYTYMYMYVYKPWFYIPQVQAYYSDIIAGHFQQSSVLSLNHKFDSGGYCP